MQIRHVLVPNPLLPMHIRPRTPPAHLSTRDLLFDREGLVYMVIRRQAVSMRISDLQLNASQILLAAELPKGQKRGCMDKLKQRGVVNKAIGKAPVWVPFRDGVFLCQRVSLDVELMPLLFYASLYLPKREDNYFFQPVTKSSSSYAETARAPVRFRSTADHGSITISRRFDVGIVGCFDFGRTAG